MWPRHSVTHKWSSFQLQAFRQKKSKMAVRKKVGAPDWKYYESPDTVALFEPVKNYLLKNCKKVIIM